MEQNTADTNEAAVKLEDRFITEEMIFHAQIFRTLPQADGPFRMTEDGIKLSWCQ